MWSRHSIINITYIKFSLAHALLNSLAQTRCHPDKDSKRDSCTALWGEMHPIEGDYFISKREKKNYEC